MGRPIRLIDNESGVMAITTRTLQGLFLMRPSEKVNDVILGVLGRAQAKYAMELHAFVFLSNHLHLMLRAESVDQLSDFMEYLDGNIARELGRIHNWKEKFWGERFHSESVGDSEASQMSWFLYVLANSCKEGLVASPLDWPGVSSANALYHGETTLTGTWFDRTEQSNARCRGKGDTEFPSEQTVRLTPPPFLAHRSPWGRRKFILDAIRSLEEQTARHHKSHKTQPLGVRAIRRQNPHKKPDHFEPSLASLFHAATQEDFWPMFYARLYKVIAYYIAAEKLRRGDSDYVFPEDCHRPPLPRGKRMAPS